MNKRELQKELRRKINEDLFYVKPEEARILTNIFLETIKETLEREENILLPGFGAFKIKEITARRGVNPQTKEPIKISARKRVAFSASKEIKDNLNKK